MLELKEFLKSSGGALALRKTGEIVVASVGATMANPLISSLLSTKANDFAKSVSAVVQSNEFTNELSNAIGVPKTTETEDEFVDRAMGAMRSLLDKRLPK